MCLSADQIDTVRIPQVTGTPTESRRVPRTAYLLNRVPAAVAPAGWMLEVRALMSWLAGLVVMRGDTAAGFILAGLSRELNRPTTGRLGREIGRVCAAGISVIGLITICSTW